VATPPEVHEAFEVLPRTPALLELWLAGLSTPWLNAREGEGTYSPLDVVAHLTDNEEVDWMPRLAIVLEHGESRPFTPYDRDGFRKRFADWPLERLLPRFAELRRANLARLEAMGLGAPDLDRTGMHPALGRVTVRQLLAGWVVHDLTHLSQIARVLAKRYGDAVGPWRAYMGVLGDREPERA
jgi:hypothetical protein